MSFIVANWMLVLIMVLSGAMLLWPLVQGRFSKMKEAGTVEVTQLINRRNAILLDVRETKEFEGGRLPNAVHIPLSQLGSRGAELAKQMSRPVVAYCESGQRSRAAGGRARQARLRRYLSPDRRLSRMEGCRIAGGEMKPPMPATDLRRQ